MAKRRGTKGKKSGKFKPKSCTLHTTKGSAKTQAKKLRKQGYRAEVERSNKTTQKRSPRLKWATFKGQRRKR